MLLDNMDKSNQFTHIGRWTRSLTTVQRISLLLLAVVGVIGVSVSLSDREAKFVPLSISSQATKRTDEIRDALTRAGLNSFRFSNGRILVPEDQATRYRDAINVLKPSSESPSEREQQLEKTGLFTTRQQLETMNDIALEKTIRRVVMAVPSIDDATITWARSKPTSWTDRDSNVTATLGVRPRAGDRLTFELVHSLQSAVARMIPDLTPDRVTVFDQSTGDSHSTDSVTYARDEQLIAWSRRWEHLITEHAQDAVAYLEQTRVDVDIDAEVVKRNVVANRLVAAADGRPSVELEESVLETEFLDALPRAVRVSVHVSPYAVPIQSDGAGRDSDAVFALIQSDIADSFEQFAHRSLPESAIYVARGPGRVIPPGGSGHHDHNHGSTSAIVPAVACFAVLAFVGVSWYRNRAESSGDHIDFRGLRSGDASVAERAAVLHEELNTATRKTDDG